MNKYLRVYWKFFKVNQSSLLAYRGNFVSSLTADIVWALFNILSFFFITQKVRSIGEWSGNEILLLGSTFNVISGVYFMMFSKNFYRLSFIVQKGLLDGILLKPIDSQFYVSSQYSNITKIVRTILCLILNFYLIQHMNVPLYPLNILTFALLALLGVVILYSVSMLLFSFVIWNPELSNLYSLIWDYIQASRYPKEIFQTINMFVFLMVLPVAFVVIIPSKALLNRLVWEDVIIISVIACLSFLAARKFWFFSLRSYTSSSL